jgi:integrase
MNIKNPDRKFAFTIAAIEKLPAPADKAREYYFDSKIDGLWLQVTKAGSKTFLVRKWVNGKVQAVTLGPYRGDAVQAKEFDFDPTRIFGKYPALNVDQARKLAGAVMAQLATGKNPQEEKIRSKEEITLLEAFELYLDRHARKARKTADEMAKNFGRYASHLGNRQLSAVSYTMAEELHSQLARQRGIYTANRTVQMLKAVFNKMKAWKVYAGDNPFQGISLFPEKPRNRFLSNQEVANLLNQLKDERNELVRDFILIVLFTGARKSNVASMKWADIDFLNARWTIPDTKNGTAQTIALGVSELNVLEARKQRSKNEYVFGTNSKARHLKDPKKAWHRIRDRSGISDCTIHDLRRSLASAMAASNVNVAIIKNALNHKDMKTTLNVYAHTQQDAVLEARQKVQSQWFKEAGFKVQKSDMAS